MSTAAIAAVLSILLATSPGAVGAAVEVTVGQLVSTGANWAGRRVIVEGELIGDYGFRDDGWMWTQLNGDVYVSSPLRGGGKPVGGNSGIGVRMPHLLARDLDGPGRYGAHGPVVRVTGTWKWHDPDRQGESYLEVDSIEVIAPGRLLPEEPDWSILALGTALLLAAAFIMPRRST